MRNTQPTTKAVTEVSIDPVCGMNVPPGQTNLFSEYEGDTYYFCAESCLKTFDENPQKYVGSKAPKRKGWLGRYLDRLSKANEREFGCSGPKCH